MTYADLFNNIIFLALMFINEFRLIWVLLDSSYYVTHFDYTHKIWRQLGPLINIAKNSIMFKVLALGSYGFKSRHFLHY